VTFDPHVTIPITVRKPRKKQTLSHFEALSSGISLKPLLQKTISRYEIWAQFDTITLFSQIEVNDR